MSDISVPKIRNKPSEEQLRQWFTVEGKSISDIVELVGVKRQTVWVWKKQFNIPVGSTPPFTEEELTRRYCVEGESQREIGSAFNVTQHVVSYWMRKWSIPTLAEDERNDIVNPVILTEHQDDMIRGMMFGDAHLKAYSGSGSGKNSYWIVEHGDRQPFYIWHIYDMLEKYMAREPWRYWRRDERCKAGGSWSTLVRVRAHRFWTRLRDIWYPSGVKIVPEQEVKKLNSRSLAYLYADDGTKCGMASNIYTLSFTRQENDLISETLKLKFGLKPQIKKLSGVNQHYIHFDRHNTRILMDVIAPHLEGLEDIRRKLVPVARARVLTRDR